MKNILSQLALFLLLACTAQAKTKDAASSADTSAETDSESQVATSAPDKPNSPTQKDNSAGSPRPGSIQDLRVSISVGGSWESYTGENQVANNLGRGLSGPRHLDADLNLGVYFKPTTESLMFGIALDFAYDNWKQSPFYVSVTQFFAAVTANYFFSGQVGHGLYVHGDLGPAMFTNAVGQVNGRTTTSASTNSPIGFGVRAGPAYAFSIAHRTSLLVSLDYGFRTAGASTAAPLTLSGGIMF